MERLRLQSLLLLIGIIAMTVSGGRHRGFGGIGSALFLRNTLRTTQSKHHPRAGIVEAYSFHSSFGRSRSGEALMINPAGQEQSVFQGGSFYAACSSSGETVQRVMWTGPEGQQITDYKGSVPYTEDRIHVEDGRSGHRGVDLVFENITRKDRGVYTCSANVDGVEISKSFTLFVHKRIDFGDTPTLQYLEEGMSSTLRCDVDGDPLPKVSWRAKGKKVKTGDKFISSPDRPNDLIVVNVTLEDAGKYTCTALQLSERTSEFMDLEIDVKVYHKPQWPDVAMSEAYSYLTGTVNLTCEAVAEPQANFTWIKDDEIITPSDTVQIINEDKKSVLQITVKNHEMFGDYVCKAENKVGTEERVIILQKGTKPAVPTAEVTHADVNALHLDLNAKNQADTPIQAYRVQYKKAGDSWNSAPALEFKKGDSYIINSLSDDTLYVVRASARNRAGYSEYSEEKMGKTKKVQAGPIVDGASSIAASALTILISLLTLSTTFL